MKAFYEGVADALDSAADAYEKHGLSPDECAALDAKNAEYRATVLASEAAFCCAQSALVERLKCKAPTAEIDTYKSAMRKYHDRVVDLMESPIERIMLPWLITINIPKFRTKVIRTARPGDDAYDRRNSLTLIPQLNVGRYRLDFALVLRTDRRTLIVDIECDGREWHSTPSDAARDRYLESLGIPTVRASGSAIHRDPLSCANRAAIALLNWL